MMNVCLTDQYGQKEPQQLRIDKGVMFMVRSFNKLWKINVSC